MWRASAATVRSSPGTLVDDWLRDSSPRNRAKLSAVPSNSDASSLAFADVDTVIVLLVSVRGEAHLGSAIARLRALRRRLPNAEQMITCPEGASRRPAEVLP